MLIRIMQIVIGFHLAPEMNDKKRSVSTTVNYFREF